MARISKTNNKSKVIGIYLILSFNFYGSVFRFCTTYFYKYFSSHQLIVIVLFFCFLNFWNLMCTNCSSQQNQMCRHFKWCSYNLLISSAPSMQKIKHKHDFLYVHVMQFDSLSVFIGIPIKMLNKNRDKKILVDKNWVNEKKSVAVSTMANIDRQTHIRTCINKYIFLSVYISLSFSHWRKLFIHSPSHSLHYFCVFSLLFANAALQTMNTSNTNKMQRILRPLWPIKKLYQWK